MSVVTPVYNGEDYIGDCVESVLRQTHTDWEYVILDNGSTDGTAEIVARYEEADHRIRVHRNEQTVSYIENWNRAVTLIDPTSRYCKILHADDWIAPDCIAAMVDLAERHPGAGIIGSWVQRGSSIAACWEEAPGDVLPGYEVGRLSLLGQIPYLFGSPSALLLRSDLVRSRDQLYDVVEHPLVDQQLCYDLLRATDFGYVKKVLSFNRLHDASITAAQEETNKWFVGKLTLLSEYGPAFLSAEEQSKRVEHYLTRYYGFLSRQVGRKRGREFWSYHTTALAQLELPLDRFRLWRRVLMDVPARVGRLLSRRTRQ